MCTRSGVAAWLRTCKVWGNGYGDRARTKGEARCETRAGVRARARVETRGEVRAGARFGATGVR